MSRIEEILRTCNNCRKNPRCINPKSIYCEQCLGSKEVEKLRFVEKMKHTPCPECGVEIGIHAEYGLMNCLYDIKKAGYAFGRGKPDYTPSKEEADK